MVFYSSFYHAASCYLVKIAEFAGPGSGTTSRQCPLGMMSLSPESQSKVRASNFSLEVSSWFAEQILTSPQLQTFFLRRQLYRSSITLVCS